MTGTGGSRAVRDGRATARMLASARASAPGCVPATAPASSQVLLARIAAGDKGALDQLFLNYRHTAMGIARRLTGTLEDAEDIVQEAFLRIMKGASRFRGARGDGSFSSWLHSILANLARDLARRRSLAQVACAPASPSGRLEDGREGAGLGEAGGLNPVEEEVESRLVTAAVRRAVGSLPGLYRAVVVLREFHNRSYREISDSLHCSVESVRARLYRARRQLRQALRRDFPEL